MSRNTADLLVVAGIVVLVVAVIVLAIALVLK
jgi:hypothetical protein